jgi:hypothetical protein
MSSVLTAIMYKVQILQMQNLILALLTLTLFPARNVPRMCIHNLQTFFKHSNIFQTFKLSLNMYQFNIFLYKE